MSFRAAPLALLSSSVLFMGCALTDHYSLASDAGSGAGGGSVGGGFAAGTGGIANDAGVDDAGDAAIAGTGAISGSGGASGAGGGANIAGSGGAAVIGPCNVACTAAETCCGSTCVNTATDEANCGECGLSCNAGRTCAESTCSLGWVKMAALPAGFVARSRAAIAAMGKTVFIWGGLDSNDNALDTGEMYSLADDSWTPVLKGPGSPSARSAATALWTGSVVIVYGGVDATGNTALKDAAAYDPLKQTWTPMGSSATRRMAALGFWDGTQAVFFGGITPAVAPIAGADRLERSLWSPSTTVGDPGALLGASSAFNGTTLYLQGGQLGGTRQDKVYSYTFESDSWTMLNNKGGPSARSSGFGAWDGSHFVVWGGRDDNTNANLSLHNDGKYLSAGNWTTMSAIGAPTARMLYGRRAGWPFAVRAGTVAIIGGVITPNYTTGNLATNGAAYDVATDTWKAIPEWPSGELHEYGSGVWTGEEFVVWGGRNQLQTGVLTTTGERLAL